MLANMTAGYRDYVQHPDLIDAVQDDPFREFTYDELIGYSLAQPFIFDSGHQLGVRPHPVRDPGPGDRSGNR